MIDIIDAMDRLLASIQEQGREPLHWQIRQEDWLKIGERFKLDLIADPKTVGANTYKGVPVHFSNLHEGAIVGIVVQAGSTEILGK